MTNAFLTRLGWLSIALLALLWIYPGVCVGATDVDGPPAGKGKSSSSSCCPIRR